MTAPHDSPRRSSASRGRPRAGGGPRTTLRHGTRVGRRRVLGLAVAGGLALAIPPSRSSAAAETITVAVAANFRDVAQAIAADFERATGHREALVAGSTGQLAAQILHGAPHDVLLAADQDRPRRLIEAGAAVADGRFTYAIGRLALFAGGDGPPLGPESLQGDVTTLSLANPRTAPYGAAAMEVLAALGVVGRFAGRLARAQNVGGAHAAVRSGAAPLGFVSYSAVIGRDGGRFWLVPDDLHAPLLQDAVLTRRGAESDGARAFLDHLRSDGARAIVEAHGYDVP